MEMLSSEIEKSNSNTFSKYQTDRKPPSPTKSISITSEKFSSIFPSQAIHLILQMTLWYLSSALTNSTGKHILNLYPKPVTLTTIQFGFVPLCFLVLSNVSNVVYLSAPSWSIYWTVMPISLFLITGHILSSVALSRIPVSFMHSIKALSPLFTVLIFRYVFKFRYPKAIYLPLLTLTIGVILVCSHTVSFNFVGVVCAMTASLVFVLQNITSKKVLGDMQLCQLEKNNVLYFSSSLSFALMLPLWLMSDGLGILESISHLFWHHEELDQAIAISPSTSTHSTLTTNNINDEFSVVSLLFLFAINGATHFGSNIFAFNVLSLVSPVTYSILSLLKRIFVIVISLVYFQDPLEWRQVLGILLTFIGCYYYNEIKLHQLGRIKEELVLDTKKLDDPAAEKAPFPLSMEVSTMGKNLWHRISRNPTYARLLKKWNRSWQPRLESKTLDNNIGMNSIKVVATKEMQRKESPMEILPDPLINFEHSPNVPSSRINAHLAKQDKHPLSVMTPPPLRHCSPLPNQIVNSPKVLHSNVSESFNTQRLSSSFHSKTHHLSQVKYLSEPDISKEELSEEQCLV